MGSSISLIVYGDSCGFPSIGYNGPSVASVQPGSLHQTTTSLGCPEEIPAKQMYVLSQGCTTCFVLLYQSEHSRSDIT